MAKNGVFRRHTFALCIARRGIRDFFRTQSVSCCNWNDYSSCIIAGLVGAKNQLFGGYRVGIIAHTSLSLGVITISLLDNVRVDLMSYLFGDLLAINFSDVVFIGIGATLICLILMLFWKRLLSITISPELAQIEGLNVARLRLLLMILTALTIALSMKFVGALIITSLLIIPSATARRFAKTPEKMVLIAIFFSIIAVSGGLLLSSWKDTPAGPSVVICAGLIFLLSLFKKEYH